MRSGLLESIIITGFQTTHEYLSSDLTKAKYSVSRMSKVEKENIIVRISPGNFSACEKSRHGDKNKIYNQFSLPNT
jgi:hypothetical protein